MKTRKKQSHLPEVAAWFLRLGLTGFGGPAVHIAMMEAEVVHRRKWMTKQQFLDLIGATNLIPGPNSTEMAMHCGYHRAGAIGMIVAGACFIVPAALLTMLIAWTYSRYGSLPKFEPYFAGIVPAIAVIVLQASLSLGKSAFRNRLLLIPACAVVIGSLAGFAEIPLLFSGAAFGVLILAGATFRGVLALILLFLTPVAQAAGRQTVSEPGLAQIFLFFLKIGSILYGSGYVLLAFLEGGLVNDLGWITNQQLVDALAAGQFTPGPVLTTATFIGYLIAGVPGAVVATAGIFLPSFVFVYAANPFIPRIRNNLWTARILDSLNAVSVALMVAVSLVLLGQSLETPAGIICLAVLSILGFGLKLNGTYLVITGALLGGVFHHLIT